MKPFSGCVAQDGFLPCSLDFIWDIGFCTASPYNIQGLQVSPSELITLLGSMHSKSISSRVHFRLFRFPVRWPDYLYPVASGANDIYSSSSSIKVHASGFWLAWHKVSPWPSSAKVATLSFLGFRWYDLPPGNLNDFLWIVLTRLSF